MRKVALIFLIIILPLMSHAITDDNIQSITSMLSAWDAEGAWREIKENLIKDEKDSQLLHLASKVAFFRGQYNEALRLIKASIESGGDENKKRDFLLFIEQTINATSNLKRFESPHFIFYINEKQDGFLIDYITEAMEKTYNSMAERYGFRPDEKVRIEIFPDTKSFYFASSLSGRDIEIGAVGQAEFNKLMLLSPAALVHGYRWLDAMSHEYMHYLIVKMTANNAPIWFHEGLAKYEETRWRNGPSYLSSINESLLSSALRERRLLRFERMEPSLVRLDTPEEVQLAYAQAASAIEFIISKTGHKGLQDMMNVMASKKKRGAEEAISEILGLTFDKFEANWEEFLKSKGLKEIKGSNLKRYKIKEGRVDEERMDMEEIRSLVSRNRTHLGDILKERGRLKASLLEYQRALRETPDSVPVLNKISSLLIDLGREGEALEFLEKARVISPDHPTIYLNMGNAYLRLRDFKKAKEAFRESIEINPFNPEVHKGLARVYEIMGEGSLASKEMEIFNGLISR